MVFNLSSHMVSFLISVSPQLLPIQWKISDTFKIKKPVKSLRPEVIFAIINLIKLAALSDPGTGRAGTRAERVPCPNRAAGASLFLRSESRPCLKHVNIPKRRVFFCYAALIFPAIHQGLPRQIALPSEKSLAAGHSSNFQTRPSSISTAAGGSTSTFRPYCYALRPLFFCKEVFLS